MSYTVSTIKSCDLWDLYLSDSCQNSFYMKASLLQRLDHTVIFKCVKKGNEVLGLFPLAGGGAHLPHIYYYGMSYMNRINELSSSNQIDQTIQIQQAICKCILANIEKVCLSLSTQISDIRGLSWSNFDDPDLNLMIEPKYTHIIDLKDKTFENLMQSFKGVRRQEIRYATEREDLIVTADDDIDALIKLYKNVFTKKNEQPNHLSIAAIKIIFDELDTSNLPFQIIKVSSPSREVVSAALIFKDYDGTVHVPIVGTGDSKYGGTLLYSSIIKWAISKDAPYIDFNGCNSPHRAFFKHSFGGESKLFFQISRNLPR